MTCLTICSTCHPRDVLSAVYRALETLIVFVLLRTLWVLWWGGLPSHFSVCCKAGIDAHVVPMSFSWKSSLPISIWNILPHGAESSNCSNISSMPICFKHLPQSIAFYHSSPSVLYPVRWSCTYKYSNVLILSKQSKGLPTPTPPPLPFSVFQNI